MKALRRPLLLGAGWLCVALGLIGLLLPLFPTTPFLLVAVWAFSRSSPEMAARIREHRFAGPYVRDWEDHGVIPLSAKIAALSMMGGMLAVLTFYSGAPAWAIIVAGVTMGGAALYILSRPSRRD